MGELEPRLEELKRETVIPWKEAMKELDEARKLSPALIGPLEDALHEVRYSELEDALERAMPSGHAVRRC